VAPAVAGVLWLFMFAPSIGVVSYALRRRHRLEPPAQRRPRDDADRDGRRVEADLLQLPVLPGRAAEHPQEPDRGRRHRRRRPLAALLDHQFPLLSPTTFFLLVINIVYAFFDTFAIVDAATSGRPGQGHRDPGLQGLLRRLQGAGPGRLGGAVVVLMVIVVALTVVQFRYVERKVNY
jgi:sn-glycerol 3-phosphate transport system permease protein